MKNIKQLTEERAVLITELEGFEARLEALTAEEETRVNAITDELETLSKDLEAAKRREEAKRTIAIHVNPVKDNVDDIKRVYNVSRAIAFAANGSKIDGVEAEMHQEGINEMRRFGFDQSSPASVVLPTSMLTKRATITENGTAGVKVVSWEDALQEESVILKAGADFTTQVSDARYIIPGSPTLAWETETGAANDVGATPSAVNLVPKRLSGYMDLTMQMLRTHDINVSDKYTTILARAVAEALDTAALTTNSDVTGWAGAGLTPSTATDAGNLALVLVEKLYESKAVRGNPAFISSAGLYAELYAALQVTGVTPLVMNDRINGFPLYFSTAVADVAAKEMIFFANWNDYAACQWGGVEILLDPYTQAGTGTLRLVLNSFFDMAQKRAASFKLGQFTGTDLS
jgi:HK97 family phage major capsid protein